ncbi:NAD kinase [Streptomyces oryzae]|uniref:NAD kinase n=1 Tax=Streptomyces oryzae TaxID=1434886 RepID=A0ABS3XF23_9ACTN|nr:NAD kinase [Streptomyces oryzae]MBO8193993.1 NAD kinase [Streptomyces oryzae]
MTEDSGATQPAQPSGTLPVSAQAPAAAEVGDRTVFLLAHTGRPAAVRSAELVVQGLLRCGIGVRVLAEEAADLPLPDRVQTVAAKPDAAEGCELLVVLGGDGTLLRGAEFARASGVPMLGVNLGRVGFLAEAERDDLDKVVDRVVSRAYEVEERMTLDVLVRNAGYNAHSPGSGHVVHADWALNEISVEKAARERMLEVVIEVDGRPVSSFGGDGVVCASPTGSTAYAFSAGGPVVWPEVEALLMVPISAHALFAKPLVTAPDSVLAVEVQPQTPHGVLWADGRRSVELPAGARVEVRRGAVPVRLARLHHASFTDRLVAKFALPVTGWRGAPR